MNKSVAIHQPYLFPYIGYFQLINAADLFVLADSVNYIKGGWINRNRILVGGKEFIITMPLHKASQNKLIEEIDLKNDPEWNEKILKTISINYRKAPFYDIVFPLIQDVINSGISKVSDYNFHCIKSISDYLGIETEFKLMSKNYDVTDKKKEEIIFEVCTAENTGKYLNAVGGMELYTKEQFWQKDIELSFIKPNFRKYRQYGDEFIAGLSIIDVMMFNSQAEIADMLTDFEVI